MAQSTDPQPSSTEPWMREPCMLGIDEAGRGPVLGACVYAVAYCSIKDREAMAKRAFADSKTLTEDKREELFEQVVADASIGHAIDVSTAKFISAKMLSRDRVSLNQLAYDATHRLIEGVLAKGVDLREIYVDTVGDADRYQERLLKKYPGIRFVVCPKADSLYPIVSAASIMAKVTRDRLMKAYQFDELALRKESCAKATGSGYPADPITKDWLAAHGDPVFGFPNIVRFSWGTCTPMLDACAGVSWECEDDGQLPLSFTAPKAPPVSSGAGRHSFFRTRKLARICAGL